MNIQIELDNEIYEYLFLLALKKNISLNLLIETFLIDLLADNAANKNN